MLGQRRAPQFLVELYLWGVVWVIEVAPGQDLSSRVISAMHFQGTPLMGGYVMLDDCVVGWCCGGAGRSF